MRTCSQNDHGKQIECPSDESCTRGLQKRPCGASTDEAGIRGRLVSWRVSWLLYGELARTSGHNKTTNSPNQRPTKAVSAVTELCKNQEMHGNAPYYFPRASSWTRKEEYVLHTWTQLGEYSSQYSPTCSFANITYSQRTTGRWAAVSGHPLNYRMDTWTYTIDSYAV